MLHVERVGHAHDARLERQRAPALAMADDRVLHLRRDHGLVGFVVDILEQVAEQVAGEVQAVRLVVDTVDRHPEVVQQAAARDHHLGVLVRERVVGLQRRFQPLPVQQPEQVQGAIEDDLQVHPRVVGHLEPLGVDLGHVPAGLQGLAGVHGRQEPAEPRVALGRGVDAHRR